MMRFQSSNNLSLSYSPDTIILNFLCHKLGPNSIKSVIMNISPHNKIQVLNLGENNITDEVIPVICEHLISKKDCPLTMLDLGGNSITDAGAQLLLKALSKNTRLVELFLAGNPEISKHTLTAIEEIIVRNKKSQQPLKPSNHPTKPRSNTA